MVPQGISPSNHATMLRHGSRMMYFLLANVQVASAMSRLALVVVACISLSPFSLVAATIERSSGADGAVITIQGELSQGDDEQFATMAGGVNGDATVVMSGPGGYLGIGLQIGSAIRMRAWSTAIPDGAICASACGTHVARRNPARGWAQRPCGLPCRMGSGSGRNEAGGWRRKRPCRFVSRAVGIDRYCRLFRHLGSAAGGEVAYRGNRQRNRHSRRNVSMTLRHPVA